MENRKIHIYRHENLVLLQDFYGNLLYKSENSGAVETHLRALAERLWEGIQQRKKAIYCEINNYHKGYLRENESTLQNSNLTKADAFQTIANEYGFLNWVGVESNENRDYDGNFERAINCLLDGNLEDLKSLVGQNKYLLQQRSSYGHRATLLHYVASNGVELWRQQVPENLPMMTKFLLEMGADKNAKMKIYGGEFDTLALLKSSAHPFNVGVGEEMIVLLK